MRGGTLAEKHELTEMLEEFRSSNVRRKSTRSQDKTSYYFFEHCYKPLKAHNHK